MDFRYVPKLNAKVHEDFQYYIEEESRFYHFVDDFNIIGVNWGEPLNISASYFVRLLQEGSSARARGRAGRTSWWDEHDEYSKDLYGFSSLFEHRAMWRLSGSRVVCTSSPYGQEKQIIDWFNELAKRFDFPETIKLMFLDSSYRFKDEGDYMIMIYDDPDLEEFNLYCSLAELRQKAISHSSYQPIKYQSNRSSYARDQYVREYALKRAKGACQLCGQPAPFIDDRTGEPFLEVHHIQALSEGGEDTIGNTVALCPNCHRKMHHTDFERDIIKLKRAASAD